MSLNEDIETGHSAVDTNPELDPGSPKKRPALGNPRSKRGFSLGLDRFSGLYVWVILIIVFSIWVPNQTATTQNTRRAEA